MQTNKSDKYSSNIKKYHSHQSIVITPNIKYEAIIPYCINRVKYRLHFMKITPIRRQGSPIPVIQSIL